MRESLIKIRQLKVAFGEKKILDNFELDVYKGETLAVIGPSGAGKSTIIKLLTGLLKPNAGTIEIMGSEVQDYSEKQWDEVRKQMGVVFQYSALFDFLSVGENVAFGLRGSHSGACKGAAGAGGYARCSKYAARRAFGRYEKAGRSGEGAGYAAQGCFL